MDISQKAGYKEPTARVTSSGKEVKRVLVVSNADTSNGMENRILEHSSTPKYGDTYPHDSTLGVSDVSVGQTVDGNFLQWEVEITYKLKSEIPDLPVATTGGSFDSNLQVSARSQQYEIPLEAGYDDKNKQYEKDGTIIIPVVSTSNETLLVPVYQSNVILDILENKQSFDFDWIREFKNSTNLKKGKIVGMDIEQDQARILDISASTQTDADGGTYYSTTMSIEITTNDFLLRPMNKGRYKANPETADETAVLPILEGDIATSADDNTKDLPVAEPVRITKANAPIPNSEEGAYYVEFKGYPSLDWSVLGIESNKP